MRGPLIDRLMARVREDERGCWLFMGAQTAGYGVIGLGGRTDGTRQTHRVSYEYFRAEIPDGLHLDHLCNVRSCCNPWHLEPVSQAENNRRMYARRGPRTHCAHGHAMTPDNVYRTRRQRRCKTCHNAILRRIYQRKKEAA